MAIFQGFIFGIGFAIAIIFYEDYIIPKLYSKKENNGNI